MYINPKALSATNLLQTLRIGLWQQKASWMIIISCTQCMHQQHGLQASSSPIHARSGSAAPCIFANHVSTRLSRSATPAPPYSLPCRFLWFPPEQHPIVCQLGGSNPQTLAAAAKVVARYGYDEINLNCGCPSERVAGAGCFGAAMMLQPQLVAQCCQAMQDAVPHIPVTVKCRLGMPCTPTHTCCCQVQIRHAWQSHTLPSPSSADWACLADLPLCQAAFLR